jgi:hypothetical protein
MRRAAALISVLALIGVSGVVPGAAQANSSLFRLFNTGCKVTRSQIHGCFFGSVKGPGVPGALAYGTREGRACGWNLLALISVGDVRIQTAMRNGGISEVSSIDYYSFELVPGFYGFSRYCTIVTGE